VKHPNNTRVLVGGTCGKKVYGVRSLPMNVNLSIFRLRQSQLKRLNDVMAAFAPFVGFLWKLHAHDSVLQSERLLAKFDSAMKPLLNRLRADSPGSRGSLIVTERVRDIAAEENKRGTENAKFLWNNHESSDI